MGRLSSRKGKYDQTKFKALAVLDAFGDVWVPSRLLILNTGAPYYSTARLLYRWTGFEYVKRRLSRLPIGSGDFEYKLQKRGKNWLAAAREQLPSAAQFDRELQLWWVILKPEIQRLMDGKFVDAVNWLDENYKRALTEVGKPA
jgi:hypothetical protein